jgi:hypothetical protein
MPQLAHDGLGQFTPAEDHFPLLAGHGGVQVAGIAKDVQRPVYRAYVVLDLG